MKKYITPVVFVTLVLVSCGGSKERQQEQGYGPTESQNVKDTFNALSAPDSLKDTSILRRGDPVQPVQK